MTKEEILERLKENIAELKYTFQIYQDTSHEEYSSEDEMEIAKNGFFPTSEKRVGLPVSL